MSIFAVILAASLANVSVPPGGSITVDTKSANEWIGSHVTVQVWDRADVSVDQTVQGIAASDVHPVVTRDGNTVTITADYTGERKSAFFGLIHEHDDDKSFTWVVHVPSKRALNVRESNGGIDVHGVTAALDLSTANGRIAVDGAGPSVAAKTANGTIDVKMQTLAGGPPNVDLHTSNGWIHLRVPRGFSTRVAAHTSNGDVTNPFSDANGPGSATVRTSNGGIEVSSGQ